MQNNYFHQWPINRLLVRKAHVWFVFFLCAAVAERFFLVLATSPSEDLEWYLNTERGVQYTSLGMDKRYVATLIDQFQGFELRLLVAAAMSGLLFSMAIFSLSRVIGEDRCSWEKAGVLLFLLMNVYFTQLDMHLWRQQLAVYSFFVAVSQSQMIRKFIFAFSAVFFHQVAVLLFMIYFVAKVLANLSRTNTRLYFLVISFINIYCAALSLFDGQVQITVVCALVICQMYLINASAVIRRMTIFCSLIICLALLVQSGVAQEFIGLAAQERLMFLAVSIVLFVFFNVFDSRRQYPSLPESMRTPTTDFSSHGIKLRKGSASDVLLALKAGFLGYYLYAPGV